MLSNPFTVILLFVVPSQQLHSRKQETLQYDHLSYACSLQVWELQETWSKFPENCTILTHNLVSQRSNGLPKCKQLSTQYEEGSKA